MDRHKNLKICSKWSKTRVCKLCKKKSDWQFANFAINIGPWKTSFIFCKKRIQKNEKQILQIIQNRNLLNLWRNHQWPPLSKVFPFSYSIRAAPQRKCPQAPLLYCVHDSPTTVFNLPIALQAASLIFISLLGELHQITHRSKSLWMRVSYLANVFPISRFQFKEAKDRSDQHGAEMLTRLVHLVVCLESDAERLLHHVTPCSSTLYVTECWEESCPVLNQLWNQDIFPSLPLPEREW